MKARTFRSTQNGGDEQDRPTEFLLPASPQTRTRSTNKKLLYIGTQGGQICRQLRDQNYMSITLGTVRKASPWLRQMAEATRWSEKMGHIHRDLPDLILCENELSDGDPFAILELVTANPYLKAIPFIILAKEADATARMRALKAGADDFYLFDHPLPSIINRIEFLRKYKYETLRLTREETPPPVFKLSWIKRSLDLLGASVMLILLSPLSGLSGLGD